MNPPSAVATLASASICVSFSLNGTVAGSMPPMRNTCARSSIRTSPRRTSVCSVELGSSLFLSSASGNSPPQAASSAKIACCFSVRFGSRASGVSTANRSIRRASRSVAAVSRAIHFLRTIPASACSVAAVAVRSVETFTASPFASRESTRRSVSISSPEIFFRPSASALNAEGGSGFNPRIKSSKSPRASAPASRPADKSRALAPDVRDRLG